jgi:hypothetical protein
MAVHFTIYPEDNIARSLRRFMAVHDCSATTAVELLLERYTHESDVYEGPSLTNVRQMPRPEVA